MSMDLSYTRPIFVTLIILMAHLVVFLILPGQIVSASTFPVPSASQLLTTFVPSNPILDFEFILQPGSSIAIVNAVFMQCELTDCQEAVSLDEISVRLVSCAGNNCTSAAFSNRHYFRLRVTFSDGVIRESNAFSLNSYVFSYENFNAS